jgi:N-ethylmaleimide reductase
MSTSEELAMKLFEPFNLGPNKLKNRIVMAPMTRGRAIDGNIPNPLAATYYSQRATAGLIITEATQVSPQGIGYPRTPGIYTPAQIEGWKKVTDSVHQAGGLIFLQLWHVGRISHPDFQGDELPVGPSAVNADGEVYTYSGKKKMVTPRALETHELPGIIEQFRQGAKNAMQAGFDGVEVHGANGYLLDQFLRDGTNKRSDIYGGSVANRARLPLEVTDAVIDVWGADRVGFRVSPRSNFNSMFDSEPVQTFSYLTRELSKRGLAYLHVVEGKSVLPQGTHPLTPILRKLFKGTCMVNEGFDGKSAELSLQEGSSDLVSFGKLFLANPDLPERLKKGAGFNQPDVATFYLGDEKGFVDYPTLNEPEKPKDNNV